MLLSPQFAEAQNQNNKEMSIGAMPSQFPCECLTVSQSLIGRLPLLRWRSPPGHLGEAVRSNNTKNGVRVAQAGTAERFRVLGA